MNRKMTDKEIGIFSRHFNHKKNFLTPSTVYFRRVFDYLVEVSEGEGFDRNKIYGVTVLEIDSNEHTAHKHDFSKCVHSLTEVESYLTTLENIHVQSQIESLDDTISELQDQRQILEGQIK